MLITSLIVKFFVGIFGAGGRWGFMFGLFYDLTQCNTASGVALFLRLRD